MRSFLAFLSLFACVMLVNSLPAQQGLPTKQEYSKGELETEQRIMRAHIKDAEFNISRGINAVAAGLAESAKVSVLRGAGRISQVEEILKGHLVRIEKLQWSLLYSRETERAKFRAELDKIRAAFAAAEDSLNALRLDMLRKGIFGEELKQQIAVLDTVPKIIEELEAKDPAKAAQVRDLVQQINEALANGDTGHAATLIKQLQDILGSAGFADRIQEGVNKINQQAAAAGVPVSGSGASSGGSGTGASGSSSTTGGAITGSGGSGAASQTPSGPKEVSRRKLPNGAEEVVTEQTVTNPDGSKTVTRVITVTNPDGSKDVTTVTENYDASGNKTGTDSQTQHFDPSGALMGSSSAKMQGNNIVITDANGNQRVVPVSFFHGGNTAPVYETRYIGGDGQVLTAEREIMIKLKLGPNGEFQGADQTPGRERSWDFSIEEVDGARTYGDDGSMQTKLTFKDRKLKTDYKITGWTITNAQGKQIAQFGAEPEVSAKFTESGAHKLTVTGQTDWGSPFIVSVVLNVAL